MIRFAANCGRSPQARAAMTKRPVPQVLNLLRNLRSVDVMALRLHCVCVGFLSTMFGRFELFDRIGFGGMAEVWRARVAGVGGFEKIQVVKKILPAFAQNKTFIDMLLAEARLCAVLQHGNIVQTYDNGEIDGVYYIAMEYVPGPDLFKLLSRATQVGMRIPPEICLFIAAEAAKGLNYAHNARDHYGKPLHIIHRDVSPSNIIISDAGEVKVMDFGVARATPNGQTSENATRSGVLKGKLGYMSPEQVTGQPFDHRSDILVSASFCTNR